MTEEPDKTSEDAEADEAAPAAGAERYESEASTAPQDTQSASATEATSTPVDDEAETPDAEATDGDTDPPADEAQEPEAAAEDEEEPEAEAEDTEAPARRLRRRRRKATQPTAEVEDAAEEGEAAEELEAEADAEEPEAEAGEPETPAQLPAPTRTSPSRRRGRRDPDLPAPVVRAQAKYVRSSARKARLVCDNIRGKSVDEARAILALTPRAIARDWSKLLESAIANAEHNHELVGEDLYVKAVHADEGPTIKRFRPRAMGRATKIRKRTSHLTILLTPKE
jgi:ribosomal protein L22